MSSDKMVKIFVGAEKQMFCLHLDLICDRVPYFKAAFTSGFKETIDMAMTMEVHSSVLELRGEIF